MVKEIQPHDILCVLTTDLPQIEYPEWFIPSEETYLTVRRGDYLNGDIPVGIRGKLRNQRFAFYINEAIVRTVHHPWELTFENMPLNRRELLPCKVSEEIIKNMSEIKCGIGGSIGFELISGEEVIKPTSDIDLLVYLYQEDNIALEKIRQITQKKESYIDVQIITKRGGFSLIEYSENRGKKILLKTDQGPVLTNKLW